MQKIIDFINEYYGLIIIAMLLLFFLINLFLKIFYNNKFYEEIKHIKQFCNETANNTHEVYNVLNKYIMLKEGGLDNKEIKKELFDWIKNEIDEREPIKLDEIFDKYYETVNSQIKQFIYWNCEVVSKEVL